MIFLLGGSNKYWISATLVIYDVYNYNDDMLKYMINIIAKLYDCVMHDGLLYMFDYMWLNLIWF